MSEELILLKNDSPIDSLDDKPADEIAQFAIQLGNRHRMQISSAFEVGHYDMALNFLWKKTTSTLKQELSIVGVSLLGEMLGRSDVDPDDDVEDILTTADAIRIAEELGLLNSTEAMRLRMTNELINHFSNLDIEASDEEMITKEEAISSLKACVKGVLGKPKLEVVSEFASFKDSLITEPLGKDSPVITLLKGSPYFFIKLAINVILTSVKSASGATLEHTLANLNTLVPIIWELLQEPERWKIGYAYSEAYADGKKVAWSALKSALVKVHGFDYVPENLRSDTFIRAAYSVIEAHEGINNYYNEPAPVKNLLHLGTTIPVPAFPLSTTALLCVYMGNYYGRSWEAASDAEKWLKSLSKDRWVYYLDKILPTEPRILNKLLMDKPFANWSRLTKEIDIVNFGIKSSDVKALVKASVASNSTKGSRVINRILKKYKG